MKNRLTITIADIQMNILTDEEPEAIEAVVGALDRRIREIFLKSQNRCPKIEAVLLCALDYCSQTRQLQDEITRLEEERQGVNISEMLAELESVKSENEKLSAVLTYTDEQSRTMKNGLDIANDRIRILKTELEASEETVARLTAELEARDAKAAEAVEEAETVETVAEEIEETVEAITEEAAESETTEVEAVEETVEEAVEEPAIEEIAEVAEAEEPAAAEEAPAETAKSPVSEIADNIVDSFQLDIQPLRKKNNPSDTDEGAQLTIDSMTEGEAAADTGAHEKEKQKAHKRVRSMFDLITFDNV